MREIALATGPIVPKWLRRLKWNELVRPGDFIQNGCRGFEPWDGPTGFRADAFIKATYRKLARPPTSLKKTP